MESIGKSSDGREIFKLWTTNEKFELVQVEALKNTNNEAFWVPKLGFTGSLGSGLFENKTDAYYSAKEILIRLEKNLEQNKNNLENSK
jgi:hypothetical protein